VVVDRAEAAVDVVVDRADVLHERIDACVGPTKVLASSARLGDADRIARALLTVASIPSL
jgi:hypothetical protein